MTATLDPGRDLAVPAHHGHLGIVAWVAVAVAVAVVDGDDGERPLPATQPGRMEGLTA